MRVRRHVEALVQDLRFSIRFMKRERTFTATVLVTLALSIGATAAVFTFVEVLLLRPLPVRSPERLFNISAPGRNIDLNPSYYSHAFYEHLRTSGPLFGDLMATSTTVSSGVNLTDGAVTDRVRGELVSGNYFEVLGVGAAAGRILTPEDDRTPASRPVLVLSYAYWQRRFAGAADVVGRTLSVNGTPFTVVGVARRGFFGTRPGFGPDVWTTLMMVRSVTTGGLAPLQRNTNYLEMIVRLEPGADVRQVQAALTAVYANWRAEGTTSALPLEQRPTLHLTPAGTGRSLLRGQYSQPLLLLMAAVGLLLLIACANVATLFMARTTARAREMAVRIAIGATRRRVLRQLITESVFIGALGGACGWTLGLYVQRAMLTFLPASAESWQFAPNMRVFALTSLLSLGSGLLFGLAPLIQVGHHSGAAALRSGRGPLRTVRRLLDAREVLTLVQVALAILLVTGAALFARTLQNLQAVDMGFDRNHILLVSIDPAKSGYSRPRTAVFFNQLLQRLRTYPEIEAVGLASHGTLSSVLPAGTRFMNTEMHAAGMRPQPAQDPTVYRNVISPGYLASMGIPLLRGRDFSDVDRPGVPVAIINEAAAQVLFGSDDPIGSRIGAGREGPADIEVIGLVKNAKYLNVREAPLPTVYVPFSGDSPMTVHVKAAADPRAVLTRLEQERRALDSGLPLFQVQTVEARLDDALRQERLVATLSTILAVLGTVIAAVGLYGLMSFAVLQRTREIGIRIAIGAEPRQILWMILRRVLLLIGVGIAVGLPLAVASLRLAASFLYGVTPSHPAIVGAVLVMLTVVGLSAGLVPARRAAHTDPCNALRQD